MKIISALDLSSHQDEVILGVTLCHYLTEGELLNIFASPFPVKQSDSSNPIL